MENETVKGINVSLTLPELENLNQKIQAKIEKLEHYAKRPLKEFIQFDAYIDGFGHFPYCDEKGDAFFKSNTMELMYGWPTVRILVEPGTKKKDALRIIKKTMEWINEWEEPFKTLEDMGIGERAAREKHPWIGRYATNQCNEGAR